MKGLRYSARILALILGGWWTYFGLASGLVEGLDPAGVLIHAALPGLVFLVSAVLAWRWEAVGGVVLLVEGVFVLAAYPVMAFKSDFSMQTVLFVLLTMALPPLAAGAMFIASWYKSRVLRMGN